MRVFDVMRRLDGETTRRLPIVDDDGSLDGAVTVDDTYTVGQNISKPIFVQKSPLAVFRG